MTTSIPCGRERYEKWKKTLFINPDAPDDELRAEYFRLRTSLSDKLANVKRVSSGIDGEIMRDVIRTFQKQEFFQRYQPGQRMLLNILFTLATAHPDVGYCQGMNYVVASLLLGRIPECYTNITSIDAVAGDSTPIPDNEECTTTGGSGDTGSGEPALAIVQAVVTETMPESLMDEAEVDVYLLMRELLQPNSKLDMAGMWKERIPKLKLRIYQLDRLLRWTYPHLHAHFTAIELSPEVLSAQWFLTLFTYTFPVVPTVLQLWDYVFLTGWEGLFKVALSLLGSLQPRLLELEDFESIVMLMREWKRKGKLIIDEPIEALLARADKFIINKEVLDRLQESFASEILSIALIRSQILFNERDTDTSGKNSPSPAPVGVRTTFANAIQNHFRPNITTNTSSSGAVSATITNSTSSITSTGSTDTTTTGLSLQHPNTTTNPTTTTTTIPVVNTGLASLSTTERRKVILEQQRKEAEIEEQLLSGAEAPVFWLLRYGTKLPDKVLQELRRIKVDLMGLDHQVDVDKQLIQAKIIKACELSRETQDEVSSAEIALYEAEATLDRGKESLQAALALARQVALEVVELMEGPSSPSPYGSPSTSTAITSNSSGSGGDGDSTAVESHSPVRGSSNNTEQQPALNLTELTEAIASFGSYHNKGFKGNGIYSTAGFNNTSSNSSSVAGSRNNSTDMRLSGGDSNSNSYTGYTNSTQPTSSSSSSTGLRFPSILTTSWSQLRRDRSHKLDTTTATSDGICSNTSIVSSPSQLHASYIARAEEAVNRDFIYDVDLNSPNQQQQQQGEGDTRRLSCNSTSNTTTSTNMPEFHGEREELPRVRSFGIDRERCSNSSSMTNTILHMESLQSTEYDDTNKSPTRDIGNQLLEESDNEEVTIKLNPVHSNSPDIPIRNSIKTPDRVVASSNILPSPSGSSGTTGSGTAIASTGGHSGGLLSTFSSQSLSWKFPVVRAIHGIAGNSGNKADGSSQSTTTAAAGSNSNNMTMLSSSGGGIRGMMQAPTRQMKVLEKRGQWVQQQIIDIDRAMEEARREVEYARRRLEQAHINNEETAQWKNSLCEQLHLLVRDSNRGRSQKLMYVAENYNL